MKYSYNLSRKNDEQENPVKDKEQVEKASPKAGM